ncbi:hypothetical protein QR680_012715 [Steinernema hermaphroditum]|uniref:PID domain-containing protein n=1 Tax=Steinernema hermaphroditum TaxID=289476 RepID=A0AA39I4J2_9BILA|nr:hypothetical protein QR680_012715 [Steinernema hermaphroditum]
MTSVPKDVYKTIKRSISATTNGLVANGSSILLSSSGAGHEAKYASASGGKQWIHPPDVLTNGRVEYTVKMLGKTEVSEAKGTQVIRDAIHQIKFKLHIDRGITGNSGAKLQKVDIQINIEGVTVLDSKTKMIISKYPLHRISFCADDKQDKRVFSFIAKVDGAEQKHVCYVFLSDKMAEKITLTIGEAFDLAYQKFIDNNGRELENKKQFIVLRKRIAELEAENTTLKEELAALYRMQPQSAAPPAPTPPPALPSSPMPKYPPPALPSEHYATPVSLAPPPTNTKRQNPGGASSTNTCSLNELMRATSEVGRQLENLDLGKMEDFDEDWFDPRAGERKRKEESVPKDPFGLTPFVQAEALPTTAQRNGEPTIEDFEAMLSKVDERLAEMRDGFQNGRLETGDTGDVGLQDSDYSTPIPPSSSRASK